MAAADSCTNCSECKNGWKGKSRLLKLGMSMPFSRTLLSFQRKYLKFSLILIFTKFVKKTCLKNYSDNPITIASITPQWRNLRRKDLSDYYIYTFFRAALPQKVDREPS